jgi:CBS domain-containing protein
VLPVLALIKNQVREEKMNTTTQWSPSNDASRIMYRFLEYTTGQFMTRAVATVTRKVTMRELEGLFRKHDYNSFPVVEEGKILGIVTKFDFLKTFAFTTDQMIPHYDELMRRSVADVMSQAVVYVEPASPLTRVLQLMVEHRTRSIPVLSSERQLVGIISREDVMGALQDATTAQDSLRGARLR